MQLLQLGQLVGDWKLQVYAQEMWSMLILVAMWTNVPKCVTLALQL